MSEDDRPDSLPVPRRRLKRLRLVAILLAGLLLGLVSFVFGIFVSVASDLPSLTRFAQFKDAKSSVLVDDLGRQLGVVSQQNRVIVAPSQIPAVVKQAVIAIEDKRFETNSGIDIRGIARAFLSDIRQQGSVQGASTIEQQFIKIALQAQSHRTIFEKLREAALAYQLAHKWSKEKIIAAYLNTIYFGNGAYGIEAAAQTYFGRERGHLDCGTPNHQLCVEQLQPWEAALLAGAIQSPAAYDAATRPAVARARRDLVLREMLQQGYLTRTVYEGSIKQPLPRPSDIQAPQEPTVEGAEVGYFSSWVQQQLVERYGAQRAFDGGLRIKTTLDLDMQRAAEQAIGGYLGYAGGPTASLVAIENATGEVRAMVGGRNYDETPFNLATSAERQPGSSFKAFDLAAALEDGISPYSVWASEQKALPVPNSGGREKFIVHNDEGAYSGSNTLLGATAYSDNSIYAEVGLDVGTQRIALLAHRMGITTPISTNPSMTIGGLTVGVTPLDMAHAYETIAQGGRRISGTLAEGGDPVGIQEVDAGSRTLPDGSHRDVNRVNSEPVLPPGVAETETSMLETVLQYGTAKAAAIGQFAAGKTGTTENYGDAWFIGWDSKYTVAVWVGYPNKLIPMTSDFNGGPVLGGTFPALIWHDFMTSALQIDKTRAEEAALKGEGSEKGSEKGAGTSTSSEAPGYPLNPESANGQTPGAGKESQAPGKPPSASGNGKTPGPAEHHEAPQGGGQPQAPSGPGPQPSAPQASPSPSTPSPTGPPPAAPPQPASPAPQPGAPPSGSGSPPSGTGGASPGG
jgi:penicillin-binding protein 1A